MILWRQPRILCWDIQRLQLLGNWEWSWVPASTTNYPTDKNSFALLRTKIINLLYDWVDALLKISHHSSKTMLRMEPHKTSLFRRWKQFDTTWPRQMSIQDVLTVSLLIKIQTRIRSLRSPLKHSQHTLEENQELTHFLSKQPYKL